jgi:5-methylcytosine-specific restriction enzyme subunit McrC
MLIYAYDMKLTHEEIAACQNERLAILEPLIQLFAKQFFLVLRDGIYKEYIMEQDNLTTLRGKYLIAENVRHNFTRQKIYCEYDEFSMDNRLNRFFLYALKRLTPYARDQKLLKQCQLMLDEVGDEHFSISHLHYQFTRLNMRFAESFELAIMLLQQFVPLFASGKKSFAFLFDMNTLFEKFVGRMVREIDPTATLQNVRTFGDLTLKPDIITQNLIIDTKYKKIASLEDIKQSDKYQMYAYGKNFGKPVMLLYPKYTASLNKRLILGDERNVPLQIKSLDLDFDGGYERYIQEMKKRVRMING